MVFMERSLTDIIIILYNIACASRIDKRCNTYNTCLLILFIPNVAWASHFTEINTVQSEEQNTE